MRSLTSIVVFAATITALPINAPAATEITTSDTADALKNSAVTSNIATTADANDGPNWGYNYGPSNYNSGPGYGAGYGPPPRPQAPERPGGALETIGYGIGSVIGTPVGWLGDLVGGAGSGLYNGLRGSYKMIKG